MQLHLLTPDPSRTCGGCTACCFGMAVRELNKPAQSRCAHQLDFRGCNIYPTRPKSCADYVCHWLAGKLDGDHLRPDRCGLIIWTWQFQPVGDVPHESILAITESTPGALQAEPGKAILNQMAREQLVLIIPHQGELRLFTADPTRMTQLAAFTQKLEALARSRPDA